MTTRALLFAALLASGCGLVATTSGEASDGGGPAVARPETGSSGKTGNSPDARGGVAGYTDAAPPGFDASLVKTCVDCLGVACAPLFVQCEQATGCDDIYQCVLAHPGDASSCTCDGSGSAGGAYLALARCIDDFACSGATCAALCGSSDSGVSASIACGAAKPDCTGAGPARSSTATCEACATSACSAFTSQCSAGTDCQAYITCLATCQDSACEDDCAAGEPDGQTAADGLDVCVGGACLAECGY